MSMKEQRLSITPEMTVADLLEYYPTLEQRLIELSPAFSKLKNPILRRTVARITTLQKAAQVAGLNALDMVNELRGMVGSSPLQKQMLEDYAAAENMGLPIEFSIPLVTHRIDVRPFLERGEHPKQRILELAEEMGISDLLELIAPFPPVPIIEILLKRGFRVSRAAISTDGAEHYYICRG